MPPISDKLTTKLVIPNYPKLEPRPPDRTLGSTQKSRFLCLPNELIHQCVHAAAEIDTGWSTRVAHRDKELIRGWVNTNTVYALALTCTTLHAIAIPILYSEVELVTDGMDLGLSDHSKAVRCYDAIKHNTALQALVNRVRIGNQSFGSELVQTFVRSSRLKSLTLVCTESWNEDLRGAPALDEVGTATFTELHLRFHSRGPQALKRFLQWPQELRVFTLDHVVSGGYDWEQFGIEPADQWSHAVINNVLSPQHQHLRVLKLGWMGYSYDENTFDVSVFPNLHTLQLCVGYTWPDIDSCRNWLTSSLRTLILAFSKADSQCGNITSYTDTKAVVVHNFARLAAERKSREGNQVALEEIGLLLYDRGEGAWEREKEWSCIHSEGTPEESAYRYGYGNNAKPRILKGLRAIEEHGFSAFWLGASGIRHTAQMMEDSCICLDYPPPKPGKKPDDIVRRWRGYYRFDAHSGRYLETSPGDN